MANSFYKIMIKTEEGVAVIMDISDTTAVAANVSSGKTFYLSNGTKAIGTSGSGGTVNPDTPNPPSGSGGGGSYWDGEFEVEDVANG